MFLDIVQWVLAGYATFKTFTPLLGKLYKERFTMRNGTVIVKNATDTPTNTAPAPDPDLVPGSADFQKLAMTEQVRIVDARTAARKATRVATGKERIKSVWKIYGKT